MNKLNRNDACWCGSGLKYKKCHMDQDLYLEKLSHQVGYEIPRDIIKSSEDIEGIRKASALTREILDMVEEKICAGISTEEVNKWVHEYTVAKGAYPAPQGISFPSWHRYLPAFARWRAFPDRFLPYRRYVTSRWSNRLNLSSR